MNKELITLVASVISLLGSLIAIFISTKLAISKERRQLLWTKELERFFLLEEMVGILAEDIGSPKPIKDRETYLLQSLNELATVAGRFSRYQDVRQSIRDLHNVLMRLYMAKRDHEDDRTIRKELEPAYFKFLHACDEVVGRKRLAP